MVQTAEEMLARDIKAAEDLPIETKKKFWKAMVEDGKNVGEARRIAGIEDVMVASQLVVLCHTAVHIPKKVEDIT